MKFKCSKDFFEKEELSEMVEMLKLESENPERMRIIEKYGQGYDLFYIDGKYDAKREIARKGLLQGLDLNIISELTGFSIEYLKKIKKDL